MENSKELVCFLIKRMIVVVFVLCVMVVVLYLTQGEEAAFCQKEVALLLLLHPTSLMSSSSHSSTTNPLLANGPVSPSKSLSFQARLLPLYQLAPSPPLTRIILAPPPLTLSPAELSSQGDQCWPPLSASDRGQ